jgi:hypothetical protein
MGSSIGDRQARCLRMIQHMKNGDQFGVFNLMGEEEFKTAVKKYCRLACTFYNREKPNLELFVNEVGNDVRSLLCNPARREQTLDAIKEASQEPAGFGIMEEINNRFVGKDC